MEFKKITAFVRRLRMEEVERRLQGIGVKGVSVSCVKGYGEYADFFSKDWLCEHARFEIFATADEVDRIISAIMNTAHSGSPGDGMIAVLPVEKVLRIKTRSEARPDEI